MVTFKVWERELTGSGAWRVITTLIGQETPRVDDGLRLGANGAEYRVTKVSRNYSGPPGAAGSSPYYNESMPDVYVMPI